MNVQQSHALFIIFMIHEFRQGCCKSYHEKIFDCEKRTKLVGIPASRGFFRFRWRTTDRKVCTKQLHQQKILPILYFALPILLFFSSDVACLSVS